MHCLVTRSEMDVSVKVWDSGNRIARRQTHSEVLGLEPVTDGAGREAAKRLGVDRDGPSGEAPARLPVHSSVAALLSWRYSQLLTALPKRCRLRAIFLTDGLALDAFPAQPVGERCQRCA